VVKVEVGVAMSSFKTEHSLEERSSESSRIVLKYADRVPVVVERSDSANASTLELLDKKKYLVPVDLTMGQFVFVIRKRLRLPATEAIYLSTHKGSIPSTSTFMKTMYEQHRDEDGFLYLVYSGENVFG